MMHALADFIMRGRLQASLIILLSLFMPLLPYGALGLVTLRQGVREGCWLIAVAILPLLIAWLIGKSVEVYFWSTLLGLLAVLIPALFLRATQLWSTCLLILVGFAALAAFFSASLLPAFFTEYEELTAVFLRFLPGADSANTDTELQTATTLAVVGLVALNIFVSGLTGLLLARWWQSLLYNPGGFGKEFHQLRLGAIASTALAIASGLCLFHGSENIFLAIVMAAPLILVAIAVVHNLVESRQISRAYLAVFYLSMIVFSPILLLLAAFGLLDSWFNIRDRLSASA